MDNAGLYWQLPGRTRGIHHIKRDRREGTYKGRSKTIDIEAMHARVAEGNSCRGTVWASSATNRHEGKSSLGIKGRNALRASIDKVQSVRTIVQIILVYGVHWSAYRGDCAEP
jgi:hypothetical protein